MKEVAIENSKVDSFLQFKRHVNDLNVYIVINKPEYIEKYPLKCLLEFSYTEEMLKLLYNCEYITLFEKMLEVSSSE